MRGLNFIRRVIRAVQRMLHSSRDDNFIGFDKYARHGAYHWQALNDEPDYRVKIDLLTERVAATDTCLDLGCGDGAYTYVLARHSKQVVGVDADFDAIRLANEQLQQHGIKNARCYQMPFSQVTLTAVGLGEPVDVVYSMDVLEHLPNPHELLDLAFGSVKPKGLVVIGTPLYIRDDLVSAYHVKEYNREELHALMSSYAPLEEELILPQLRHDNQVYPEGFYVAMMRKPV